MSKALSKIKRFLPRCVITQIGLFKVFNRLWGQNRQNGGVCVDGNSNPVPWITYPAIEFLNQIDFSQANVFEFGAGSSTLWWASRVGSVTSVEREEDWYKRLLPILPGNVSIVLEPNEINYPKHISVAGQKYDVVVIDGAVRYPCAQEAINYLAAGGIILLDNTEWYPKLANMLRGHEFTQIDFSGFGPINSYPSCTSLFFKSDKWLKRRKNLEHWTPVGGRWLQAHDDCSISEIDRSLLKK